MTMQQPPPMPVRQINVQDETHLNLISVLHFVMGGLYLLGIGFLILHYMIMAMVLQMAEAESQTPPASPSAVIAVSPTPATPEEAATLLASPPVAVPTTPTSPPFPKEILPILNIFYVVCGAFLIALCICNILVGLHMRKRKHRIFSLVVAGVNCLQFPFGTALGIFTFIVLSRVGVKMDYDANASA